MLEIIRRDEEEITILTLIGKFAFGLPIEEWRDCTRRIMFDKRRKVILNLEQVTFVDDSGISELVSFFINLRRKGGVLKLFPLDGEIQNALREAKMMAAFEIFGNEDTATISFQTLVP